MKIFLLLLFLLSSWLYNTIFLNLYFSSKISWESLRFRGLTKTLFVFRNLWQATISIASNTTQKLLKISRTCFLSESFIILFRIPSMSMHSRGQHYTSLCIFISISTTFSFLLLQLLERVKKVFFQLFSKLLVIIYQFRLFSYDIIL